MNNLTIEHIRQYPNLKGKTISSDLICEVIGVDYKKRLIKVEYPEPIKAYSNELGWEAEGKAWWCDPEEFKPILYDLSYLKETEGAKNDYIISQIVEDTASYCDAYDEWLEAFIDIPFPERLLQAPYEVVQECLKRHVNVFNLDESLFINKATL